MSMLRLRLLGHVDLHHAYFADGRCRRMRFEPTPACSAVITAFDLVVRADDSALAVHAPEHRLVELWQALCAAQAPATLDFNVRSLDPAFAYYTEGATDGSTDQVARLPLGEPAGGDAAAGQAAWLAGLGQRVVLQWPSRQSIWRYWLMGDWCEKVIAIVDTEGAREFEPLGLTALGESSAQQAFCFRSRGPLALSDRAPAGLQLRAGHSAAATRVVMSQLPAPRPTALHYEDGPNGRQAVSEVFVSR